MDELGLIRVDIAEETTRIAIKGADREEARGTSRVLFKEPKECSKRFPIDAVLIDRWLF